MQIVKKDFEQDYDNVIKKVAEAAFEAALAHVATVVDENQQKLHFNFADVCNVLTQVAQARRAVDAQKT